MTLTADDVLLYEDADRLFVDPNGAARTLTLPAVKQGAFVQITNTADAAEDITLNKPDDTLLLTISQGQTKSAICSNVAWFEGAGATSGVTDSDAIHDNVASEISAISAITPAEADFLVAEDASNSNTKGSVTVGQIRSHVDADDYTAQTAVVLAPGNATTGDAGDNGVTGTWTGTLQGGSVSVDTSDQPASGNGAIKAGNGLSLPLTTNQLLVNLSETVTAGADQQYVSMNIWVDRSEVDLDGHLRIAVAADDDLATVHSSQDVGGLSYGIWQRIICPLSNSSIKSVGVQLYAAVEGTSGTDRIDTRVADVELMSMTEAMVALANTSTQDIIIQPDYSPTGSEFPVPEIFSDVAGGMMDLRSTMRIISDFNGSKYVRQYWIDDTGATDMTEQLSRIFATLDTGDELIFPHYGIIRYDDVGTTEPSNGALQLWAKTDVKIVGNKSMIFTPARRNDTMIEIVNCSRIQIDDLYLFSERQDTIEGNTLTTVSGTPTTNGDDVELNAQDEEVRTSVISQGRIHTWKYAYDIVASDSNQVANDLEWEVRSPNRPLTVATASGDTTVTLTDNTIDSGGGTTTLTFSTGDMVNDGVQVGMRVFNDSGNPVNDNGTISAVTATTIDINAGAAGDFANTDTVHIGWRDDDDQPRFHAATAEFFNDGVIKGDVVVNATTGSKAAIVENGIQNDGLTTASVEFSTGDTLEVYHRFGTGTETLTASPATYEIRVTPTTLSEETQLHIKKSTATANTITIEEVVQYNPSSYNATYDAVHGINVTADEGNYATDITLNRLHVEGGFGGDAITTSSNGARYIYVNDCTSIAMGRQGMSFNRGEWIFVNNPTIIRPYRSAIDIEPFGSEDNWLAANIYVKGGIIVAPGNWGFACENWEEIRNLHVDGVYMSKDLNTDASGPNGFYTGGSTRGSITNCTFMAEADNGILAKGKDMFIHGNRMATIKVQAGERVYVYDNYHIGSGAVNAGLTSTATNSWIHNQSLQANTKGNDNADDDKLHPIQLGDSIVNSGVIGILTGWYYNNYSTTFKGPYALHNTWFPGGLNMLSDPLRNVSQIAGKGVTTQGNNSGERARAADGGTQWGSDNIYFYPFPTVSVPNATFASSNTQAQEKSGGTLSNGTSYTVLVRFQSEYGGPGGTGETDTDTVTAPENAYTMRVDNVTSGTTFSRGFTFYRKTTGNYTHRYDYKLDDYSVLHVQGLVGGLTDFYHVEDLGTTLNIDPSFLNETATARTGTVTLTGDTHDGGDNLSYLVDASADFIADGVEVGMKLDNTTDGSSAIITAVTPTQILTAGLSGGTDDDFDNGDVITVTQEWVGNEDETGWEPDANYSVFIQASWSMVDTPIVYPDRAGFTVDWGTTTPSAGDTFDYWIVRNPTAS